MSYVGRMKHLRDWVQDIQSIAELEGAKAESEAVEPERPGLIVIHFNNYSE